MRKELEWPEWNRRRDPELWDFYAENVLEPGWPGQLTEGEYDYIKEKLSRYRRLRNRWGFIDDEKPISFETVQVVAMWGEPSDPTRNAELINKVLSKPRRKQKAVK